MSTAASMDRNGSQLDSGLAEAIESSRNAQFASATGVGEIGDPASLLMQIKQAVSLLQIDRNQQNMFRDVLTRAELAFRAYRSKSDADVAAYKEQARNVLRLANEERLKLQTREGHYRNVIAGLESEVTALKKQLDACNSDTQMQQLAIARGEIVVARDALVAAAERDETSQDIQRTVSALSGLEEHCARSREDMKRFEVAVMEKAVSIVDGCMQQQRGADAAARETLWERLEHRIAFDMEAGAKQREECRAHLAKVVAKADAAHAAALEALREKEAENTKTYLRQREELAHLQKEVLSGALTSKAKLLEATEREMETLRDQLLAQIDAAAASRHATLVAQKAAIDQEILDSRAAHMKAIEDAVAEVEQRLDKEHRERIAALASEGAARATVREAEHLARLSQLEAALEGAEATRIAAVAAANEEGAAKLAVYQAEIREEKAAMLLAHQKDVEMLRQQIAVDRESALCNAADSYAAKMKDQMESCVAELRGKFDKAAEERLQILTLHQEEVGRLKAELEARSLLVESTEKEIAASAASFDERLSGTIAVAVKEMKMKLEDALAAKESQLVTLQHELARLKAEVLTQEQVLRVTEANLASARSSDIPVTAAIESLQKRLDVALAERDSAVASLATLNQQAADIAVDHGLQIAALQAKALEDRSVAIANVTKSFEERISATVSSAVHDAKARFDASNEERTAALTQCHSEIGRLKGELSAEKLRTAAAEASLERARSADVPSFATVEALEKRLYDACIERDEAVTKAANYAAALEKVEITEKQHRSKWLEEMDKRIHAIVERENQCSQKIARERALLETAIEARFTDRLLEVSRAADERVAAEIARSADLRTKQSTAHASELQRRQQDFDEKLKLAKEAAVSKEIQIRDSMEQSFTLRTKALNDAADQRVLEEVASCNRRREAESAQLTARIRDLQAEMNSAVASANDAARAWWTEQITLLKQQHDSERESAMLHSRRHDEELMATQAELERQLRTRFQDSIELMKKTYEDRITEAAKNSDDALETSERRRMDSEMRIRDQYQRLIAQKEESFSSTLMQHELHVISLQVTAERNSIAREESMARSHLLTSYASAERFLASVDEIRHEYSAIVSAEKDANDQLEKKLAEMSTEMVTLRASIAEIENRARAECSERFHSILKSVHKMSHTAIERASRTVLDSARDQVADSVGAVDSSIAYDRYTSVLKDTTAEELRTLRESLTEQRSRERSGFAKLAAMTTQLRNLWNTLCIPPEHHANFLLEGDWAAVFAGGAEVIAAKLEEEVNFLEKQVPIFAEVTRREFIKQQLTEKTIDSITRSALRDEFSRLTSDLHGKLQQWQLETGKPFLYCGKEYKPTRNAA